MAVSLLSAGNPEKAGSFSIVESTLKEHTKAQFPKELIEQFGFNSLWWRSLTKRNHPPITFIGSEQEMADIGQAAVIISIARKSDYRAGIIHPPETQVSVVRQDSMQQKRILVVTFSGYSEHRICEISLSINRAEIPESYIAGKGLSSTNLGEIPRDYISLYHSYGFVTERMRDEVSKAGIGPHKYALRFFDPYRTGDRIDRMALYGVLPSDPKRYFLEREDDRITVVRPLQPFCTQNTLNLWEVSLFNSLQAA